MKRTRFTVALGGLSCLVAACYQTYTGIYFLNRSDDLSRKRAEEVAHGLTPVLNEFGLSEMREPEGNPVVSFASGQHAVSPQIQNLPGSDARVSVAVRLDSASITIRDFSNTAETEFVKALKGRIERHLEVSGIAGVQFERQKDFFFY